MIRIRLIHFNQAEAEEKAKRLRAAGYRVSSERIDGPAGLRELRQNPPDAMIIDLSRVPSHGRDIALAIREAKSTRGLPLVFVEGEPEKVERVRELLPDATYTQWSRIRSALRHALAHAPADPVVPSSRMAGYAGASLVKKLGLKTNMVIVLVGAPEGFESTLGALPAGALVRRGKGGRRDLTLWFVTSLRELEGRIDRMAGQIGGSGIWIIWPKKSSGVQADLNQNDVRRVGLAAGLVDYKISAIDETWSGLKFKRRGPGSRS